MRLILAFVIAGMALQVVNSSAVLWVTLFGSWWALRFFWPPHRN